MDRSVYSPEDDLFLSYSDAIVPVAVDHLAEYLDQQEFRASFHADLGREVVTFYILKRMNAAVETHIYLMVDLYEPILWVAGFWDSIAGYTGPGFSEYIATKPWSNWAVSVLWLDQMGYVSANGLADPYAWIAERYPEFSLKALTGVSDFEGGVDYIMAFHEELRRNRKPVYLPVEQQVLYDVVPIFSLIYQGPAAVAKPKENAVYVFNRASAMISDISLPRYRFFLYQNGQWVEGTIVSYNPKQKVCGVDYFVPLEPSPEFEQEDGVDIFAQNYANLPELVRPSDDELSSSEQYWPFDPEIATTYFGNVGWFVPAMFRFWEPSINLFKDYGILVGSISDAYLDGMAKSFVTVERTPIVLIQPKEAFQRTDTEEYPYRKGLKTELDEVYYLVRKQLKSYARLFLMVDVRRIAILRDKEFVSYHIDSYNAKKYRYKSAHEFANATHFRVSSVDPDYELYANALLKSWISGNFATMSLDMVRSGLFL